MAAGRKRVTDYEHTEATRLNNPPAGLAQEDIAPPPTRAFVTTPVDEDPRLPPELVWWGKADTDAFDVEAPSIHIHEALTTEAIIAAARRESAQPALFADPELDRSAQVAFYEHEGRWRNRLVLGDSLTVMSSLLERERMGGQVQMIYIDPPYGVNYNSNFQARLSRRSAKEGSDDALTREPEQIQAYRDTWEKGVHSYLTYLRQRLIASRDLLADSGSVFVQISNENVHHIRELLDEVFGPENFCSQITFLKTSSAGSPSGGTNVLPATSDFILWYAKDRDQVKYRQLYTAKTAGGAGSEQYTWVELPDGERRRMTREERAGIGELPEGSRIFRPDNLTSQSGVEKTRYPVQVFGRDFRPPTGVWKTSKEGMKRLIEADRLILVGNTLSYVRYIDDFPAFPIADVWSDTRTSGFADRKVYVVQTNPKVIARCMLMTTDPGDLVIDPTCGSGTTAYVAEQYGRRWITCETSRVAFALARERILTSAFPYYELEDDDRGVDGGFRLNRINRVTLRSVAQQLPAEDIPLHDEPIVDKSRVRVSGPFTVEALARYADNPFVDEATAREEAGSPEAAENHVTALLDALKAMGIPRRGISPAPVLTLQRLANSGPLHAEGTFVNGGGKEERFAVSLGPRHGPVTVGQIDEALHDAYGYDLVVFAGFAATAEAQEYLREGKRGRFKVALLEANADLLLGDLLKNTKASQTFRLFSAPDVKVARAEDGQVEVELLGMDSFDAATGKVTSRSQLEIAAWFVDHDYDGLVFHVNQAFFTRSRAWDALGKSLKGVIEAEVVDAMHSFTSLPFTPGKKIAVRVVDDAGQTSEAIIDVDGAGQ
ncbi:MAG: site-specific DNA-methyltransferase [Actinobacteria bacterium]|nr:site-specific DNA-methyltransferase [Actinomycetota bacterium]